MELAATKNIDELMTKVLVDVGNCSPVITIGDLFTEPLRCHL